MLGLYWCWGCIGVSVGVSGSVSVNASVIFNGNLL